VATKTKTLERNKPTPGKMSPPTSELLKFTLHAPPSTNHLYVRKGRGTFISPRYRQWRKEAVLIIEEAHRTRQFYAQPPYAVQITAHVSRRRDIDNLIKPILDALEDSKLIEDDRHVDEIRIVRGPTGACFRSVEGQCRVALFGNINTYQMD